MLSPQGYQGGEVTFWLMGSVLFPVRGLCATARALICVL